MTTSSPGCSGLTLLPVPRGPRPGHRGPAAARGLHRRPSLRAQRGNRPRRAGRGRRRAAVGDLAGHQAMRLRLRVLLGDAPHGRPDPGPARHHPRQPRGRAAGVPVRRGAAAAPRPARDHRHVLRVHHRPADQRHPRPGHGPEAGGQGRLRQHRLRRPAVDVLPGPRRLRQGHGRRPRVQQTRAADLAVGGRAPLHRARACRTCTRSPTCWTRASSS